MFVKIEFQGLLAGCMYRIRESAGDSFLGSGLQVLKVYVDID